MSITWGGGDLTKQWMHCIGLAHGEYVVIASDDDVYDKRFAEECMSLASKYPIVDIIRGGMKDVDEEGQLLWEEDLSPLSGDCISQIEYTWAYRQGVVSICIGNLVFRRSALLAKGFKSFPKALGSDISVAIELSEHGMALAGAGLFSFRHSTVHLSGSLTQLSPKLDAINGFYDWIMSFPLAEPQTELDKKLLEDLTLEGWREKCIYDYFNQVIRYVAPKDLFSYLARTKYARPKDKVMMVLRYIKRRIF